jgi:hypothetical protein
MKIHLDHIAGATANVPLRAEVTLTAEIPALAGVVLAVRVLDDKAQYNELEDVGGVMRRYRKGEVVAGVLGSRRALRGYTGEVPARVAVGDHLHLLNLGGVIGRCTSACASVGPAARVEVLGAIVDPRPGATAGAASIRPGRIGLDEVLVAPPPTIYLLGSCMSAGKTAAAAALVGELSRAGLRVGAAKVTGVALRRDVLELVAEGAVSAYTFADAGLPSTCGGPAEAALLAAATRGCLNALGRDGVDVAVVEFGDGLLGDYGVLELLEHADLRAAAGAVVFAASDPVAAWGGVALLSARGMAVDVVTGPATDHDAGSAALRTRLGVAAANARSQPGLLAAEVRAALRQRRGVSASRAPAAAAGAGARAVAGWAAPACAEVAP